MNKFTSNKVIAGSFISALLIASAYAQTTYTDYYFNVVSGTGKLSDAANFNVGSATGEAATTRPTTSTNVYINNVTNGFTANTNYANFNAHDVTFKVADAGTNTSGAIFLLTENNTANITGDFLFSARSATEWSQTESGIKVLNNAKFNVGGDFTIENNNIADANNAGFKFAFKHHSSDHTNGSVNIAGNLNFKATQKGSTWPTERIEMITRVTNFTVQGHVDLTQPIVRGTINNLIWDLKGAGDAGLGDVGYINIGGLCGDGALKYSKASSEVNLTFMNKQSFAWSGSLGVVDSTAKLYLKMNATDASAKQTLRFTADSHDLDVNDSLYNSTIHTPNSVTVSNGILEMNTSGNINGALIMGTKTGSAVFSATGVSSANNDGTIAFTSIAWNDGTFVFDVLPAIAGGDLINVVKNGDDTATGKFTVQSGATGLKMKFNISQSDLMQYIIDNEVESLEQTIMTWETSSNIGDYLSQIEIDSGATNCKLSVVGNNLVATFTVPEPATIAALFGVLALAFAMIRRRK